jgi:hypothetical protein
VEGGKDVPRHHALQKIEARARIKGSLNEALISGARKGLPVGLVPKSFRLPQNGHDNVKGYEGPPPPHSC